MTSLLFHVRTIACIYTWALLRQRQLCVIKQTEIGCVICCVRWQLVQRSLIIVTSSELSLGIQTLSLKRRPLSTWRRKERGCFWRPQINWKLPLIILMCVVTCVVGFLFVFVVYLLLFVCICCLLFVYIIIFQSTRTDCNHIFLHFVPPIIMDPKKVQ